MKKRALFLCNTVYQILVAVWIKYKYLSECECDVIISNHMKGGKHLSERFRKIRLFEEVYYGETLEISRYQTTTNKYKNVKNNAFPLQYIKQYIPLKNKYSDLYFANFDGFSQALYNALSRNVPDIKIHIFEDGLSTYCLFEEFYNYFEHYYGEADNFLKRFFHNNVYRLKSIYGNLHEILVFNPQCMQWDPKCYIHEMEKIDSKDDVFRKIINYIFEYETSVDKYDKKYVFFEESFFADGYAVNDVELVEKIAQKVGKDNLMIKIHPRNPENRFAKKGYLTNKDISIPWEVILMNMEDVSDKTFITVASSTILNPIMIFGMKIKAYSLYPCLNEIPPVLEGKSWEFLHGLYKKYSDMICLCQSIDEIQ